MVFVGFGFVLDTRWGAKLLGRRLHHAVERGEDTEVSKCRVLKQEGPLFDLLGQLYI